MSSQGYGMQGAFDLVDVDVSSTALEIVSETLTSEHTLIESQGIRGTRSRTKERVRRGLINVGGSIVMHPSPTELDVLLYPILGGTETVDVWELAETVPEFDIMIDKVAKVYDFEDLKVNRAIFRSSAGQPLELELDLVGKTMVETNAGTFPALTFDTDTMYVHSDVVFTYNSTAYEPMDIEIVIDNFLDTRFTNSTTATSNDAGDRRVTVNVTTPFTSAETSLYSVATVAGAAGSIVYTNGGQVLTFTLRNMKLAPGRTPTVPGRTEIPLTSSFNCYKSGSSSELQVTHDSTA